MKNDINSYFKNLNSILLQVIANTGDNKELDIFTGLEEAIDIIVSQTKKGNKLIFIGNGGSASIASHMAIDFWKNGGMKALSFNDGAQLTCLSNDFGYQHVFEKPIRMFAEEDDILVAISSSGRSENILKAVSAGKDKKCHVITMSGFSFDNPIRSAGHLNFYVPSDSYGFVEIIHQALCHCILDLIIEQKAKKLVKGAV